MFNFTFICLSLITLIIALCIYSFLVLILTLKQFSFHSYLLFFCLLSWSFSLFGIVLTLYFSPTLSSLTYWCSLHFSPLTNVFSAFSISTLTNLHSISQLLSSIPPLQYRVFFFSVLLLTIFWLLTYYLLSFLCFPNSAPSDSVLIPEHGKLPGTNNKFEKLRARGKQPSWRIFPFGSERSTANSSQFQKPIILPSVSRASESMDSDVLHANKDIPEQKCDCSNVLAAEYPLIANYLRLCVTWLIGMAMLVHQQEIFISC